MLNPIPSNQPPQAPPQAPPPQQPPQPPAPPEPKDVVFSWNPQDRDVMQPTTKVIPGVTVGDSPSVEKAKLNDRLEAVDGNYVFENHDSRQLPAITFAAVANAIKVFEQAYGDFNWSFGGPQLEVNANAGEMFNAYYSRWQGSVNFFHAPDPIENKQVLSGHSGEIVTHEVGHAVLDGIRPGYLSTWSTDPGAFHESFGDQLAILMGLQDDRVLDRLVVQTGGDLSKPNVLALMAEELGSGINNSRGQNVTGGDYIRNANNKFVWQDPATLPERGDDEHLGSEVHSFSRLWTGAFFDVVKSITKENIEAGQPPKEAMRNAGTEVLTMLGQQMKEAPHGDFTYADMARAWVNADNLHNGGKRAAMLEQIFTNRLILPTEPPPPEPQPPQQPPTLDAVEDSGPPVRNLTVKLSGDGFGQFEGAIVDVPVDRKKALFKSDEVQANTQSQIKRLIAQGKIRYNEPNYQMKLPQDAFNPKGEPYIGAVTWENGQMKIERLPVAT